METVEVTRSISPELNPIKTQTISKEPVVAEAVAPVVTEVTADPVNEVNKEEPTPIHSRRLAELTKKERAFYEREKGFKESQSAFESERSKHADLFEAIKLLESPDSNKAEAALKFLEASKIDYEALTDFILSEKQAEPQYLTREEAKKLAQEELEADRSKRAEEADTKFFEETKAEYKKTIEQTAKSKELMFFLSSDDSVDVALDLTLQYFQTHGTALPLDTALAEVDNFVKARKFEEYTKLKTLFEKEPIAPVKVLATPPIKEKATIKVPDNKELSKEELLRTFVKQLNSQN